MKTTLQNNSELRIGSHCDLLVCVEAGLTVLQ